MLNRMLPIFFFLIFSISYLYAADCASGKFRNPQGVCVWNNTVAAGVQTAAVGTLITGFGALTAVTGFGIPLTAWGASVTVHGSTLAVLGMYECGVTVQSGACSSNAPTVSNPPAFSGLASNVVRVKLTPPSAATVAAMRGNNIPAKIVPSTVSGAQLEAFMYSTPLNFTNDFIKVTSDSWQIVNDKCSQIDAPTNYTQANFPTPTSAPSAFPIKEIPIDGQFGSLVAIDAFCVKNLNQSNQQMILAHVIVAVHCNSGTTPRGGIATSAGNTTYGTFSQDKLNETGLSAEKLMSCIPDDTPDGYIDNKKFVDYKITEKGAILSLDSTSIISAEGDMGLKVYEDGSINLVKAQRLIGVSAAGNLFSQDVAVVQSLDASGNSDAVTMYSDLPSSGDTPSPNDHYELPNGSEVQCSSGASCTGDTRGDAAVSYLGGSGLGGIGDSGSCGTGQTLVAGQCQCPGGTLPVNGTCGAGNGNGNGNGLCSTPPCTIDFGPAGNGPDLGSPSLDSIKDLLNGKGVFDNLLAWRIPHHASTCPAIQMNIPYLHGAVSENRYCDLYTAVSPTISNIFLLIWSVIALFVVLRA